MFKRTFCNMVTEVMHRHIAVNVYLDGESQAYLQDLI